MRLYLIIGAHYVTSRKVAGSIPDKVIGFFNWPNPSSRTMALGSTQPLTEIILGVKGGWCIRLTTLLPSVSWLFRKCGNLNVSQPYGPSQSVIRIALPCFTLLLFVENNSILDLPEHFLFCKYLIFCYNSHTTGSARRIERHWMLLCCQMSQERCGAGRWW
jgi:hypothetical protein